MKQNLSKRPCVDQINCRSSDGLQPYLHDNGYIDAHCFACNRNFKNLQLESGVLKTQRRKMREELTKEEVLTYPIRGDDNDRDIFESVSKRFGVRVSINQTTGEADTAYYPYYIRGKLSGFKVRGLPKDFERTNIGVIKGAELFGQHLCSPNNKTVVITEGEEDCLAVAQTLWGYSQKKKWPNVVSLVNGAGIGKKFDKEAKFLNSHDRIIACFDNDDDGKKALQQLSLHVDIKKLYTMNLSEKDANECLWTGKQQEIIDNFFNPQPYRPEHVFKSSELLDDLFKEENNVSYQYPTDWYEFNRTTEGMRKGELDVFTAASSNGKTQLFRVIIDHILKTTKAKIGCIFLEESHESTLYGIASIRVGKRLTVPSVRNSLTEEEKEKVRDVLRADDRLIIRKNKWDNMSDTSIYSAINYMCAVQGCEFIFIDHLNMILANSGLSSNGNSTAKIEEIVSKLKTLACTLNVWVGLNAHLRKSNRSGQSFDRGAIASQEDLKDSSGVFQRPDGIYFLQRNRFHGQENMRNVSRLHVLKARVMSSCGEADFLEYDINSGRMKSIPNPGTSILEKRKEEEEYEDF